MLQAGQQHSYQIVVLHTVALVSYWFALMWVLIVRPIVEPSAGCVATQGFGLECSEVLKVMNMKQLLKCLSHVKKMMEVIFLMLLGLRVAPFLEI